MSIKEWHADIEVTNASVKNVLQEQFPEISPIENIQLLGEGWDNQIYLINENIVFRFPRRKASIELMERETQILSHLPDFPGIKTPRLKYIGKSTALHPYPCQGYEMIKGVSGYQANLTEQERNENIVILAKFLKQLHSINAQSEQMGVVPQGFGSRSNIDETIKILSERTDKLILHKILNINTPCLRNEINLARKLTLPDEHCFVHGDLDCRHLIFDGKKLTGIIDWGDTDITNRSVDLDIVWTFFTSDCHKKFFEIYGAVESNTWQYARFLGLYCAFSLALYAKDLHDDLLFIESINSIKRINPDLLMRT